MKGCGCDLWDGHNGKFQPLQSHNFSTGYNDFSVMWNESGLSWFVNDVLYHERSLENVPFIPTEPFYMILNTAIDWWNKKSGTPLDAYPVEFAIDFVRFYKKKNGSRASYKLYGVVVMTSYLTMCNPVLQEKSTKDMCSITLLVHWIE